MSLLLLIIKLVTFIHQIQKNLFLCGKYHISKPLKETAGDFSFISFFLLSTKSHVWTQTNNELMY